MCSLCKGVRACSDQYAHRLRVPAHGGVVYGFIAGVVSVVDVGAVVEQPGDRLGVWPAGICNMSALAPPGHACATS